MIDWRATYHDLCVELDILQLREKDLRDQCLAAHDGLYKHVMPLDKAVTVFNHTADNLNTIRQLIHDKTTIKQQMEQKMSRFEGLDYRVAYMRDIQGMHLDTIANELGYSYGYIRNISNKVKRCDNRMTQRKIVS